MSGIEAVVRREKIAAEESVDALAEVTSVLQNLRVNREHDESSWRVWEVGSRLRFRIWGMWGLGLRRRLPFVVKARVESNARDFALILHFESDEGRYLVRLPAVDAAYHSLFESIIAELRLRLMAA